MPFCSFLVFILPLFQWFDGFYREPLLLEKGQPATFYSNQIDDDLSQLYLKAIGNAQHSILMINYALTDPRIISSLSQRANEGIHVHVICDIKASPYIEQKLGKKVTTVRRIGKGLMHQKILVIDKQMTWLGSANMTPESLTKHGNLIIGLSDRPFAKVMLKKGNSMKAEGAHLNIPSECLSIGGQQVEIWFLPDRQAVSRLIKLIQSAKKVIKIAMFAWTHQELAAEVINAKQRGVEVQVVIDHFSGKAASAKIVKQLEKGGVTVKLSPSGTLLHHKFMVIDDKILVNGSTNWTKAAFSINEDCFLILHPLNKTQKKKMKNLWEIIQKA